MANQPLWDPPLANAAVMADNCMKLGAVILKPPKPGVGFGLESKGGGDGPQHPQQHEEDPRSQS